MGFFYIMKTRMIILELEEPQRTGYGILFIFSFLLWTRKVNLNETSIPKIKCKCSLTWFFFIFNKFINKNRNTLNLQSLLNREWHIKPFYCDAYSPFFFAHFSQGRVFASNHVIIIATVQNMFQYY